MIKCGDVKIPYTFFVCSDIHSAYTPWMDALKKAGFNENKYNHKIILCGDAFDRMGESEEVLHFIMDMVDKDKIILIKGNHDTLLKECCLREFPYGYDRSNGTMRTITDLGGMDEGRPFNECCRVTWHKLARYRELLVNYFETKNYIFVHSWMPTTTDDNGFYEYDENWREADYKRWEDAMWENPFDMHRSGLNGTGKTIVFGHWHCSTGWAEKEGCSEFGEDAKFDIFYGDRHIAIDACTAYSGKVNVLVLEDELLEE